MKLLCCGPKLVRNWYLPFALNTEKEEKGVYFLPSDPRDDVEGQMVLAPFDKL